MRFPHRSSRGAALVVVLVIIAVLTVVGAGIVVRSRSAMESAGAHRQYETGVSCADGARELLLSRFRAFQVNVADLQLDETVAGRRVSSGHYNDFNVKTVEPLAGKGVIAADSVMGMANRSSRVPLGGAPYRVTVVCSDSSSGRQAEVEFLIRFGL